jgi:PAT family beta-lactamase induction signal transducer AmpG
MTLPAQFLGGFAGLVVDHYGYYIFFIYASAVGLPAISLILLLLSRERRLKMLPQSP